MSSSGRGRVPEFSVNFRSFWLFCLGSRPTFRVPGIILGFVFLWRCFCQQKPVAPQRLDDAGFLDHVLLQLVLLDTVGALTQVLLRSGQVP